MKSRDIPRAGQLGKMGVLKDALYERVWHSYGWRYSHSTASNIFCLGDILCRFFGIDSSNHANMIN